MLAFCRFDEVWTEADDDDQMGEDERKAERCLHFDAQQFGRFLFWTALFSKIQFSSEAFYYNND